MQHYTIHRLGLPGTVQVYGAIIDRHAGKVIIKTSSKQYVPCWLAENGYTAMSNPIGMEYLKDARKLIHDGSETPPNVTTPIVTLQ